MQEISQGLIITDPQSGTRFSLIRKLGEGGFGEVWLAYDKTDIHHQVAIKFFNPLNASDKNLFLGEYERSAKFHHKDILPSLFYGEWGTRLFMGMGYCEYGTASQFVGELNPNSSDSENLLWNLIYDVASGLEYLHDNQNIVHQDIKPENIMITSDGDFVIMDFGISINVTSRLASLNYKDFGSPAYMAPERFTNSGNVIFANDIWSFGVMLYELVTGELPFNGLGGNYLVGNCPSISNEWSIELNKVIQSCLVYEPWSRKKAKDIRIYADWVLRGKRGLDPWGNFQPNTIYPSTNMGVGQPPYDSPHSGTQRVGNHQSSRDSNPNGGRSTSRNNSSSVSSNSQHNGRSTSRNNQQQSSNNSINSNQPVNQSAGARNNSSNISDNGETDDDMKYKKRSQILLGLCALMLIACVSVFLYYSNKIIRIEGDLNQRIETQGDIINNAQNLIDEILALCQSANNGVTVETFPDWQSSNHESNSQGLKEYEFLGGKGDKLSFNYDLDSEQNCDKLLCYLISPTDTIKLLEISGRSKIGSKDFIIDTDSEYTVSLQYNKDYSVSHGKDMVKISNIRITRSVPNEIQKKISNYREQN